MSRWYRRDGTPYPEGIQGMMQACQGDWKEDRVVHQETLWNGIFLSTVFLSLDHNWNPEARPLIFETMAFHKLMGSWSDLVCDRYSSEWEAELGHHYWRDDVGSLGFTLKLWWTEILNAYFERDD